MCTESTADSDAIDVTSSQEEMKTGTLLTTPAIKVVRLVLPEGKLIPEHTAPGEITVHCLQGAVDFTTAARTHRLTTGQLFHVADKQPHSLQAMADSVVLVTIAFV